MYKRLPWKQLYRGILKSIFSHPIPFSTKNQTSHPSPPGPEGPGASANDEKNGKVAGGSNAKCIVNQIGDIDMRHIKMECRLNSAGELYLFSFSFFPRETERGQRRQVTGKSE